MTDTSTEVSSPTIYYIANERRDTIPVASVGSPAEVVDVTAPDPSIQSLIATLLLLVTAFMFQQVDQSNILYASLLIMVLLTASLLLIISTVRIRKQTRLRREFDVWVEHSGDDTEAQKYGMSDQYRSARKATIVNIVFSFINVSWQSTVIIIGMVSWVVERVGL